MGESDGTSLEAARARARPDRLGLVTAGHVAAAGDPALQSGKYSVTVLDGGFSENVTLQTGDIIKTDSNTILSFEFLIGGRVGVNASTEVKLTGDRSIEDLNVSAKTHALKQWDLWVSGATTKALKTPLEIDTNGGAMGIKG